MGSRRMWMRLRRVMTQTSPAHESRRSKGPGAAVLAGSAVVVALMPGLLPRWLCSRRPCRPRSAWRTRRRATAGGWRCRRPARRRRRARAAAVVARPGSLRTTARSRRPSSDTSTAPRAKRGDGRSGPGVGRRQGDLEELRAGGRLELVRRALRDHAAVVDHGDAVGQGVGLIEVLRREPEGDALGDQAADHAPHALPARGVEAGGGLVQKEHGGPHDQAGGQVEAAAHAAGVALDHAVGGVVQLEEARAARRPGCAPANAAGG